jgi:hypothetical protein
MLVHADEGPGSQVERPEAEPRTYDLDAGPESRRTLAVAGTGVWLWVVVPIGNSAGGRPVGCGHPFAVDPPRARRRHGAFHR